MTLNAGSEMAPRFFVQLNILTFIPLWYIQITMHVIAKPALVAFWSKYPGALPSLTAWHRVIQGNEYASFAELKMHFASADHVKGLTVFNIAGNKYRLIAAIHYNRRKVYVRHILAHSEYDLGKWRLP